MYVSNFKTAFLPSPHLARLVTHSVSRMWPYWIPWCNATTHMVFLVLSNLVHHWRNNFAVELLCTLAMVICSAFLNIHSIDCYSDQQTLRNPRQTVTVFTFLPSTFLRRQGRRENTTLTPQPGKSGYETTTSHEVRIISVDLCHLVLHFLLSNNPESFPRLFNIQYRLLSKMHNKCSLE